jgi:hypothetical protein
MGLNKPGKYEYTTDPDLAEDLDQLDPDAEYGDVDEWTGHLRLVGEYILTTDSQGFVYVDEFGSIADARLEWDGLIAEYAKETERREAAEGE